MTIAFFLDETFEELQYDITTTVAEAVEQLAGCIKLENYSTFTLYESRRVYCLADLAHILMHAFQERAPQPSRKMCVASDTNSHK